MIRGGDKVEFIGLKCTKEFKKAVVDAAERNDKTVSAFIRDTMLEQDTVKKIFADTVAGNTH